MTEKTPSSYKGLQVIGAGLPRTATTSLHNALETLGYFPCHTFRTHICDDPIPYNHIRTWRKALTLQHDKPARQALLRHLYESSGVPAAVDAPTCLFVDDLVEIYPEAKVVLGIRSSPAAWRTSFNATIGRVMCTTTKMATVLFPVMRFGLHPLLDRMDALSRERYGYAWSDWEAEEAYTRHNEWVKNVVPKERLLEFEPKMGYEGLCGFLGVEPPRDAEGMVLAFPRVNESKGFEQAMKFFICIGWGSWVLVVLAVVGAAKWFGLV